MRAWGLLWCTLSPVPMVSGPPKVCTLPLVLQIWARYPPTPLRERRAAGRRGDRSCCCWRIPQSAPEGLFLFEKILLLSPDAPYKEGPVLSHSPPLQLDRGLSRSGPHMAQLSPLPSQHPQSSCVYHFVLIPLTVTSSNQVCLSAAQALFGRGGSH